MIQAYKITATVTDTILAHGEDEAISQFQSRTPEWDEIESVAAELVSTNEELRADMDEDR